MALRREINGGVCLIICPNNGLLIKTKYKQKTYIPVVHLYRLFTLVIIQVLMADLNIVYISPFCKWNADFFFPFTIFSSFMSVVPNYLVLYYRYNSAWISKYISNNNFSMIHSLFFKNMYTERQKKLITFLERHLFKSKALKWIKIGHRLAIVVLTNHISKTNVCLNQKE